MNNETQIEFTFDNTRYHAHAVRVQTGTETEYHVTIDNSLLVEKYGANHIFTKDSIENLVHKGELLNGRDFTEILRQALDEELPFLDTPSAKI